MKPEKRGLLLVFVLLFILCSCQTSAPEIVPEYNSEVGSVDLEGADLLWGWSTVNDVDFGFISGTAHSDIVLERKREIEDNFNCSIQMEYKNDVFSALRSGVMSGSPYYDIVTGESFSLVNDVRAGYLTGLSIYIDEENTDKWGTPNMLQSLIWKDDIYGVVPYAWPELMYTSFGYPIVVNENLIMRLGQTDPREYVENLVWTWDKFGECLEAYTYQDAGRTIYGMAANDSYFVMMIFLSNGDTVSSYQDGKVICGAYTDSAFVSFERARDFYWGTYKDYFWPGDPWGGVGVELFLNQDVVMYTAQPDEILGTSNSIMYHAENVGILPYPQGPNATPGKYSTYHESLLYSTGIPVNANEVEACVAVLDAMYEPFEEYKTKEDVIKYMGEQIFFDERDARVLSNMLENTEYGFFLEGARAAIQNILEKQDAISSILESHEDNYATIVSQYMEPHFEGRISVYGE